ncbi:hypothetical protein BDB00DRAFT_933892 [Zychaea mexicana]|uniref:uncharacterized protein n=1 Tax=Zychaea mexicana TaxID=64656 RepID=UPI0022FF31B4|nr:uncharacterized protein BDB00DRAFT_933892 [Zychaea mexicana]KAI9482539.1 hypothetical protein BDB00DRAFT_933892 [Zychaea mexicana]
MGPVSVKKLSDQRDSIQVCNTTTSPSPFVALGLFLIYDAQSLVDTRNNDGITVKRLFMLAMDHYNRLLGSERHLIETLNQTLETQNQEYQRIWKLVVSKAPNCRPNSAYIAGMELRF